VDWVPVAMLGACLAGYTVTIIAGLALSYPRYFLPACLLLLPFIGAGAGALLSGATALLGGRASPPDPT
jgi:hypothetical protein